MSAPIAMTTSVRKANVDEQGATLHRRAGPRRDLSMEQAYVVGAERSRDYPDDPAGDRTRDLRIKSPLLYQLSYRVVCCPTTT